MVQLIGGFSVIAGCVVLIFTIYIVNLALPKEKRNEKLTKPFFSFLSTIYSDNVKLSVFVTMLVFLLLLILGNVYGREMVVSEIGKGFFIEAFGMFFDALILVLLFNFIAAKGERDNLIRRYFEEIEDFRPWRDSEAKFRIRGNILRLNKLNISKFDLTSLDLSDLKLLEVKLNGSTLSDTDFTNTHLNKAQFVGILCSGSHFSTKDGKGCFLDEANFSEAHIQYSYFTGARLPSANFSKAILSRVDFKRADLRFATFEGAYIYDSIFDYCEVDEKFLERLKQSNITGNFNFEVYEVIDVPVKNYIGAYRFLLRKKVKTS